MPSECSLCEYPSIEMVRWQKDVQYLFHIFLTLNVENK